MSMKNKIQSIAFLLVLTFFTSCDEKLTIDTLVQGAPEIDSFEPESGKSGTEITITGSYLRDILSATIGGTEAPIKYKISQEKMVVVVPTGAKSGKIVLKTKAENVESGSNFTVVFPTPALQKVPASGKVDEEIEIQGSNLDAVTKVFFKETEATITFQSDKELVVKVPFVADDRVDVYLQYLNEQGTQRIGTTGSAFEIVKDRPGIGTAMPAKVTEGEVITLNGENLNLVESVLFGATPAVITRKEASVISFRIPTLPQTATVAVTASYYAGTASLTLSDACEVFIPKVFFYPNLMLGAHRSDIGNIINATTGVVNTACILKDKAAQITQDFASVFNSNYDFALNGPHNTTGGLRNYWCDGKTFITGTTADALIAEGYGDFLATKTLFLVLQDSDPVQAGIINKVKSGALTEISPEATPVLFNGSIVINGNSVRSRRTNEAEDLTSAVIYKAGSVVVFFNERKNKSGILLIREVNVNYTQAKAYNDSNASIVFDLYYQR